MTLTKAYLFLCRHPSPYERQLPAPPDGAVVAAAAPAGAGGGHRRPSWGQARNLTGQPGVQQMSLGDATACTGDFQSAAHMR